MHSLKYATKILSKPKNLLLLFPQGSFQSAHRYPVTFEKGWFRILEKAPANTQVVFMASLCDYFEFRKPALNVYLHHVRPESASEINSVTQSVGKPGQALFPDAGAVEAAYNVFLKDAIEAQEKQAFDRVQGD